MAELSARSGVPRETIHFYLREGLLPRPVKGGRTVAFYGPEHLERLRTIRRLREEKYLPLAVIKRLLESPAAAAERDLDALADVLHIAPDAPGEAAPPAAASVEAAAARGLLGPGRAGAGAQPGDDPAERRILAVVEEVLALEPAARALTLDDLAACAAGLTGLVEREAELFFDAAFRSGDMAATIAALRSGRGAVARFITAYRDLMLRRLVEDLLSSIERGRDIVAQAATVPLSAEAEARLGVPARREALRAAAAGDAAAAAALCWHLFGCGAAAELTRLPAEIAAAAGAEGAVLVAWGGEVERRSAASLRALADAAAGAPGFALGQLLASEAAIVQVLGRREGGASLLEASMPALRQVACADPASDPDPLARLCGLFLQGRIDLMLPAAMGRRRRGAASLREALGLSRDAALAAAEPAACARVAGNAALLLGRHEAASGERAAARALFDEAASVDPEGLIGKAARAARAALDQS